MPPLLVGDNASTMSRADFLTALDDARHASTPPSTSSAHDVRGCYAYDGVDAIANAHEAYGAYVSLMRSGLFCDCAPLVDGAHGVVFIACEPRETPTERRKDAPREKRARTFAVPLAVARTCLTPELFDILASIGGTSPSPRVFACFVGIFFASSSRN